jgi:hypothetical protein
MSYPHLPPTRNRRAAVREDLSARRFLPPDFTTDDLGMILVAVLLCVLALDMAWPR